MVRDGSRKFAHSMWPLKFNLGFHFQKHNINLAHIESRSSKRAADAYEFMLEIDSESQGDAQAALDNLKEKSEYYFQLRNEFMGIEI